MVSNVIEPIDKVQNCSKNFVNGCPQIMAILDSIYTPCESLLDDIEYIFNRAIDGPVGSSKYDLMTLG